MRKGSIEGTLKGHSGSATQELPRLRIPILRHLAGGHFLPIKSTWPRFRESANRRHRIRIARIPPPSSGLAADITTIRVDSSNQCAQREQPRGRGYLHTYLPIQYVPTYLQPSRFSAGETASGGCCWQQHQQ